MAVLQLADKLHDEVGEHINNIRTSAKACCAFAPVKKDGLGCIFIPGFDSTCRNLESEAE